MFLTYGWLMWVPEVLIGFVYGLFVRSWFLRGKKAAYLGIPFVTWFIITLALSQTQMHGSEILDSVRLMAFFIYGVCYVLMLGGTMFSIAAIAGALARLA